MQACDIIDKLLAKNAEDRYQSADGLLTDLHICMHGLCSENKPEPRLIGHTCVAEEEETKGEAKRVLTNFKAGKVDALSRFSVSNKLYGRDQQIAILTGALDRVVHGATEVNKKNIF